MSTFQLVNGGTAAGCTADVLAAELEDATGDAVIVVDANDVIVRWSEAASRLVGGSTQEAVGRRASDVLPLPFRDGAAPSVHELLARGERWAAAPDPASTRRGIVWSAAPVRSATGEHLGAIYRAHANGLASTAKTVSSDERTALRAFDAAFENLAVLDRQRRVLAINETFQRSVMKAHGRALAIGEDVLSVAAPGSEVGFLEGFARALAGERVRRVVPVKYPNGQEFHHLVEYTPLLVEGEVTAVLFGSVVVDDIRGSSTAGALLERGLDAASFVVLVADARLPGLPIVAASGGLERATGYSREEVIGRNARLFQGRFAAQPALEVVRRAILSGEACDVVLQNERKDGTAFLNRLSLTPVRDDLGAISHFIGIQEDVTQREALLVRVQASQAEEMARQMLWTTVHDLRNLLTVISAEVGFAHEDVAHMPAVAESLAAALEAVQRAGALTRALLSPVTRSTSVSQATSIKQLMGAIEVVARYTVPNVHLDIDLSTDAEEALVLGDQGALEQVLLNVVLNASAAMPEGGRVCITMASGTPEGLAMSTEAVLAQAYWTIAVADEGVGMSEDVLARVFEPYFTTKEHGKGTGLGLSSCATLVAAAGGRMNVRSSPGRGTTVYVTLPRASRASGSLGNIQRSSAARSIAGVEVLIVEPDTRVRAALSTSLRRRGAIVHDAGDVDVARSLAVGLGDGAVLAIDGSRFLRGARELVDEWLRPPGRSVVVLGGEMDSLDLSGSRTTELSKPFDHDELVRSIAALLVAAGHLAPDPPA